MRVHRFRWRGKRRATCSRPCPPRSGAPPQHGPWPEAEGHHARIRGRLLRPFWRRLDRGSVWLTQRLNVEPLERRIGCKLVDEDDYVGAVSAATGDDDRVVVKEGRVSSNPLTGCKVG